MIYNAYQLDLKVAWTEILLTKNNGRLFIGLHHWEQSILEFYLNVHASNHNDSSAVCIGKLCCSYNIQTASLLSQNYTGCWSKMKFHSCSVSWYHFNRSGYNYLNGSLMCQANTSCSSPANELLKTMHMFLCTVVNI